MQNNHALTDVRYFNQDAKSAINLRNDKNFFLSIIPYITRLVHFRAVGWSKKKIVSFILTYKILFILSVLLLNPLLFDSAWRIDCSAQKGKVHSRTGHRDPKGE
jgi:hypothetical protein